MAADQSPAEERSIERGGAELVVATDERSRGSEAPFFAVYRDPDRSRQYGWFCANCESVDAAMDPMGRIECTDCGNRRRATRWDAGYL